MNANIKGLNLGPLSINKPGDNNVVVNSMVLTNFSKLLKQEGSGMKLIVGELDAFSNPGACDHCQLRALQVKHFLIYQSPACSTDPLTILTALQTAAFLNLYQSRSDLIKAICYVNAFERLQQEVRIISIIAALYEFYRYLQLRTELNI